MSDLKKIRKKNKRNGMLEGIVWNYGSLVILSVSGFLYNCLITYFYDVAALGVFNRTYAWYCVLSQVTTMGIHMSVVKLIPEYKEKRRERDKIINAALVDVFLISGIGVIAIESVVPYIITDNSNFLRSMQIAMPGLLFFSLNKVILNYLNGLSEMKSYAILQSIRYISIVVIIWLLGIWRCNNIWLSFSFVGAEIVLFVATLIYLLYRKLLGRGIGIQYIKEHIKFGMHIFPANMVLELNTKVDIICLGFVLRDDYLIGIYSFAILFVEGFYQLYIIIRRSINPKITESYVVSNLQQEIEKINVNLKKYLRFFSPIALLLVVVGYYVICFFLGQRDYIVGSKYLIIICIAIMISGRKIVFGNIFAQTGFPIYESLINLITVASNFLLNLFLIYVWGLLGAAIATAISHLIFGLMMHCCTKKKLHVNI